MCFFFEVKDPSIFYIDHLRILVLVISLALLRDNIYLDHSSFIGRFSKCPCKNQVILKLIPKNNSTMSYEEAAFVFCSSVPLLTHA